VFLNNMKLPPNIARNTALRENVFMMVVCIELKIPLFLVGKPGSSKSLAKSIVADSMQGDASSSLLFREFKQVYQSYLIKCNCNIFTYLIRFSCFHINAVSTLLQKPFWKCLPMLQIFRREKKGKSMSL